MHTNVSFRGNRPPPSCDTGVRVIGPNLLLACTSSQEGASVKLISSVVRPARVEAVRRALNEIDVVAVTITELYDFEPQPRQSVARLLDTSTTLPNSTTRRNNSEGWP